MKKILLVLLFLSFNLHASQPFYHAGDGKVSLTNPKTNQKATVEYYTQDGYSENALAQINQLFGIGKASKDEKISLRLIALLDSLQDHFNNGMITLVSGYRSPEYNEGLRKKGKLAAMTSLHIEGMAADIDIADTDGKKLWEYVRGLSCCGAGYYHGKGIHIDTGPVRFWDETSTKVKEKLGEHNKLIITTTDKDIYQPGDEAHLPLSRITDYPLSIHKSGLLKKDDKVVGKVSLNTDATDCLVIKNRHQAKNLSWVISEDAKADEKLKLEFSFCEKPFPEMKDTISSNVFSIRK